MLACKFQVLVLTINKSILKDFLAWMSVNECLGPFIKVLLPAETFLDSTYLPSLESSF